jgi:hypothetical protein
LTEHRFALALFMFLVATGVIVHQMWIRRSVGIGCAYLFQLGMFYAAGPCLHALPWSELPNNETVFDGFLVSAYGAIAFAAGWCLRPMVFSIAPSRPGHQDQSIAKVYLMCGVFSFFVLQPLLAGLPSIASIAHAAGQLTLAGFCLGAFLAWHRGGWKPMLTWVIPSLLLPVVTVFRLGFLGYGIIALSVVAIFCATFARPRWLLATGFIIAAYCGLSVFTAYMQTRTEIRAAVWGGEDLAGRAAPILLAASRIQPFDFTNQTDLETFDDRMDQSYLAGLAVERLSESGDFAHGETLKNAALAIIPRIFWPDKPMSGGSGDLVSRFTGLHFAKGTSVGVGTVMELYVNFGLPCVIGGFLVFGLLLSYADSQAAEHLRAGDWQRFLLWFLFGLSFLQVGGSLVEVISSAGASVVTAHLINAILTGRTRARVRSATRQEPSPNAA